MSHARELSDFFAKLQLISFYHFLGAKGNLAFLLCWSTRGWYILLSNAMKCTLWKKELFIKAVRGKTAWRPATRHDGIQCTSTLLQRPTWPWSCSCSGTCARGRVTRCAPSSSCGTSPSPPSASSAPRGRSRSSFSHFNTESTTRSVTPGSFSLWGLSYNSYACLSVADGILTEDLIATLMYCIMI